MFKVKNNVAPEITREIFVVKKTHMTFIKGKVGRGTALCPALLVAKRDAARKNEIKSANIFLF